MPLIDFKPKYFLCSVIKGKSVPLINPSFQPFPFRSLFAIFIPSVFEVVQVGQVVQPRQPWLCAVPPEKCQPEKWDNSATPVPPCTTFFKPNYLMWDAETRASSACTTFPTLYHLFLRHARLHSDTEDAGGEPVDPGFADLRQANLRLVFTVAAGQQAFCFLA